MAKHNEPRKPMVPTAAEDRAIQAGIAADPDTFEVTQEVLARMQPLRKVGRPKMERPKALMTMRVDADVLQSIKSSGDGWQTRVNALLREAVEKGKLQA